MKRKLFIAAGLAIAVVGVFNPQVLRIYYFLATICCFVIYLLLEDDDAQ